MGAPLGNKNAAKAKVWAAAIHRALERRKPADERIKAIDELADKLIDQCFTGDMVAIKELGDRLDGKAVQILGGDDDNPIVIREITIRAVDAVADRSPPKGS
jgi:hypothetical protein